ncbi:hypothetical protein J7T55_005559 [Diaporthe amygdali]|uniref:uncharacterized protein n=1 Tax=Phomopsis amygdali TaxID=1214568 RepID=UPI0022FF44E9|nr:uncharacterized protein J7T55_005559 [Diaporthe amygdali]KAJ0109011.1 hypothetical protein J7T55_005559 [Diaporthe amygdali]
MAVTRSASKAARACPKKHVTSSGHIEKPKKATKAIKKEKGLMEAIAQNYEQEDETDFKKAVDLGAALFQKRRDRPWKEYSGLCLLGLPGEIRNKIFKEVLPIESSDKVDKPRNTFEYGFIQYHEMVLVRQMFKVKGKGSLDEPRGLDCRVHPILRTCRQLRYEYGALVMTNNHFSWNITGNLDCTQVTCFAQHAASVGAPGFKLSMNLSPRFEIVQFTGRLASPMRGVDPEKKKFHQWLKEVYDCMVEMQVCRRTIRLANCAVNAMRHMIKNERRDQVWEAAFKAESLAEVALGVDIINRRLKRQD